MDIKNIIPDIDNLSQDQIIEKMNQIKIILHENWPFKNEPVDCVIWVKNEEVVANNYNPNEVAPPEMDLLKISIWEDWYTQPIVTMKENDKNTVIDWFHRSRVWKESENIRNRVYWYLPIVLIREDKEGIDCRMASTIRHNRARWTHKVHSMSEIVLELKKRNWSDEKISKQLWMWKDEVLRLSQIQWLADMFKDKEFSKAREIEDDDLSTIELIEW